MDTQTQKKNTSEILLREEPAERQFDGMEAAALKKFYGHRYVLALVFFFVMNQGLAVFDWRVSRIRS